MSLTDIFIRGLKQNGSAQKHTDSGGLYLYVSPTGGRLWRLDYRFAGKRKTLSFGKYPAVSLKDARQKREEAKEQLAGQICRYARLVGHCKYDVTSGLTEALPAIQTKHLAAITDPVEIGHLLRAIDGYQGDISIVYALKILPYVFVRSVEIRGATWAEIDLDSAEWMIPAGRMKMRQPHAVPLARQVVKLLEALREYSGHGALAFPSPFSGTRCISDMGLLNALRRMGYAKGEMTIHGFRSMASTRLNEMGYRADVIEAQLAHGERNAVRKAYNRAAYLEERREMMQRYADYLDGLRCGQSAGGL